MPKDQPKIPVLIDTREQRPWELNDELFTTERATLATGDYSITGMEHQRFVLERKSAGDLVQTLIHDWLRFRRELYRLASFDFALIVVECNIEDIWNHKYETDAKPESVIGRVNGIFLDHGLQTAFWGPRPLCVASVERLLLLANKKLKVS